MDKNFFKFDIDDAILISETNKDISLEKVQNTNEKCEKELQNDGLLCFKGKLNTKSVNGYEKKLGLSTKREINPNLCEVEDYINFDFKIRNKKINELLDNNIENIAQTFSNFNEDVLKDAEVENVLLKAHIGVIFD